MAGHRPLDVAQGMMKVMGDDRELQVMKAWGQSEASSAHPCFAAPTEYDKQRGLWRVPVAR